MCAFCRRLVLLSLSLILVLATIGPVLAAPVLSQVGNLLTNGNFEVGSPISVSSAGVPVASALGSWNQFANTSGITSSWVISPLIEGDHTGRVQGDLDDGLFQYPGLTGGDYTLSGWVYVASGSAHLGIAWNSGSNSAFGLASNLLNQWQYLTVTVTGLGASSGGALAYSAANGSDFYVEGLWLNSGRTSASPFAQSAGFDPNVIPEPSSWILAILALGLVALQRRLAVGLQPFRAVLDAASLNFNSMDPAISERRHHPA